MIDASGGATISGYTYQGQAYVVEENITSEQDLEATVREEVFHRGLPQLLGKGYTNELSRIFNSRGGVDGLIELAASLGDAQFSTRYQGVIARVQANPRDTAARYELVEEVIARAAENPVADRGFIPALKRVFAQVKQFARKLGLDVGGVSNADIYLLARQAFKAGKDSTGAIDDGIKFSLKSDNQGLLTRGSDGGLRVTDVDGTRDASTLRSRATQDAKDKQTLVKEWFEGKRDGKKRGLRDAVLNSTWYQNLQQHITQVHAPVIQHDNNLNRAPAGTPKKVIDTIKAASGYLADRSVLSDILDTLTNDVDYRTILNPSSFLVLRQSVARNIFNTRQVSDDNKTLQQIQAEMELGLRALRDVTGESEKDVMTSANRYLVARSGKDRNRVLWYTVGADLKGALGKERKALVNRLKEGDASAWPDLTALVDTHDPRPADYKASGMTDSEIDAYLAAVEQDPSTKPHYEALFTKARELVEATNNLDRQTNKLSQSVENVINAYGWQDTYLPMKGQDEDVDTSLRGVYGNTLDESFRQVEGRESVPDALGSVMRTANKAAEYAASQDVTRSIAVNVAAYQHSADFRRVDKSDLFKGTIKQYDINSKAFKKLLSKKEKNRLLHYAPDGQVLVIKLDTQRGVDAIKGIQSDVADGAESLLRKGKIPQATSLISSLFTYRNAPFLPFDAIRTTLTYAYNISNDEDFAAVQDFTGVLMSNGYMKTIGSFSKLLADKDFAGIEALVKKEGPNSIAADLNEFIQLGGRNEFLDSIRLDPIETSGALQSSAAGAKKGLQNFDKAFQAINNATDLMGRFAFYQVKVQRGAPKKAAAAQAVNLANFGARGTWSGPLGGLFAFFRATSSGAFGQINNALNGQNTGPTMAVAAGAGAMLYVLAHALSDEDENDNNRVAEMDGKRFIKDFSFRLAGEDVRFGTGFGPVANAMTAGIQLTRFVMGHQSFQDTADNTISAVKDTSAVVPLPGTSPTSDPLRFLFDAAVPSLAKPAVQYWTNTNGLGFDVYTGEADNPYDARLSTKGSLAESIALTASEAGIVDVNPDVLQHFARSYLGTIWSAMEAVDEIGSEVTDQDHVFNFRKGTYFGNQFTGPESFTQVQSDYYDRLARYIDQEQRIKDLRRAGLDEAADQQESDPEYQELFPIADRADSELKRINEQYRDIWNDVTLSRSARENAYEEARQLRTQVLREALDEAGIRNQIRGQ